MKKILALALALLVIGSAATLVACGGDEEKPDEGTPGVDVQPPVEEPTTPDTPTVPGETDEPTTPGVETPVDEQVIVSATVYFRAQPSYDSPVLGEIHVGTVLTRVSIAGEWSCIRLDSADFSGEYYTSTNCLKAYTAPQLPEEPDTPDTPTTPGETDEPTTPDTPTEPGDTDEPTTPADPSEFVAISPAETVYVITDALNVRKEATTQSEMVGQVVFATPLPRTAKNDSWSRISYNGGVYYVSSAYVTTDNITGSDYIVLSTPKTMKVTASVLNARSYPHVSDDESMENELIKKNLGKGDVVTVVAESPDKSWVRIRMADESFLYVRAKYLDGYGGAVSDGGASDSGSTTTPTIAFNAITQVTMYPVRAGVEVYSTAGDLTSLAKTLSMSDPVQVTAVSEDYLWYKVKLSATDTTFYYIEVTNLASGGKS